jgi:hypothetical protein
MRGVNVYLNVNLIVVSLSDYETGERSLLLKKITWFSQLKTCLIDGQILLKIWIGLSSFY